MSGPPAYTSMTNFAEGSYEYPKQTSQQQTSQANVIVSQPYPLPQVSVVQPRTTSTTPWTLIFAVVLTIVLGVQLFIPSFFCLVPGVILAVVGYARSDSKEDRYTVKAVNGVSLCCNMAALIFYLTVIMAGIITVLYFFSIVYVYYRYD